MDIVYPVGTGRRNWLRWSLRSLSNLPHGQVWIVGDAKPWLRNTNHIETDQRFDRHRNSTLNVRTACEHPDVSDPFVLMNDDFFIMKPIDEVPTKHRGTVADMIAWLSRRKTNRGSYVKGLIETSKVLTDLGYDEPLCYELHLPIVIHKQAMIDALDAGSKIKTLHKRTLYGNIAGLGGEQYADVKVKQAGEPHDPEATFLSTASQSWRHGEIGRHIRRQFRTPSPYEEAPS